MRRSGGQESHGRLPGPGCVWVEFASSRLLLSGTLDGEDLEAEEALASIVEEPITALPLDAATSALRTEAEADDVVVETWDGQGMVSCFRGRPRGLLGVLGADSSRIFLGLPLGRLKGVKFAIAAVNWPSGGR